MRSSLYQICRNCGYVIGGEATVRSVEEITDSAAERSVRSPEPTEARTDANDGTPSLRAVPLAYRRTHGSGGFPEAMGSHTDPVSVARDWRWARATGVGSVSRLGVEDSPTGRRRGAEPPPPPSPS